MNESWLFIINRESVVGCSSEMMILLHQNTKRRGSGKKCHDRNYDTQ
jgi:hypothetical protein